jgi:hypothetical protein
MLSSAFHRSHVNVAVDIGRKRTYFRKGEQSWRRDVTPISLISELISRFATPCTIGNF